ncbi:SPFH domain-containing protein [Marmoricola sp. RAF53]|uniref:SPFH domain-containing protein n=1 Tax=Marmoricola sp. RAF53 TaxID=3233059 RepID=UPI003F96A897
MTFSKGKILALALVGSLGLALLVAAQFGTGYNTPSDMVAIRVGAGPAEAKKVKGCIPSNDRQWFWQTNDDYHYFPTSEREWDATGQTGSDTGRMKSITLDNVEMLIPVTVRFTLKTDCDDLKDFYTRYARRYGVEFAKDGSYNAEWITLLRKLIGDPTDQTLDRIVQGYNWRDVWKNPATKVEIEKKLNESLQSSTSLLDQTAKGSFFDGISVLVGTPDPKNQELKDAVAREQAAVSDAQSKEAEARARAAQANAELAVSRAEAAKQRAAIDGYPSVDAYLKAQCIAKGCNPYQPTYLYGGTPQ